MRIARTIATLAAIGLLLAGMAALTSAGEPVIVAFGDSTTAPRGELTVYATVLEKELRAQGVPTKVVNAGVPGNSTADARERFARDVLAQSPSVVIIQFGINDAAVDVWRDPPATAARVSLPKYEENLRYFIDTLRAQGAKAILMTPNPMRWAKKTRELYSKPPYRPDDADGFNVLLSGYAETVRRVARDTKTPLIDVYQAFEAYGHEPGHAMDELLLDGMHPNAQGQELVAKLLLRSGSLK